MLLPHPVTSMETPQREDNDGFGAALDDLFYILDACNGAH